MEVQLRPDLEAKLSRIAAARGSNIEVLAKEAIEHFVEYDDWFLREVEKGLESADRGALLTQEEVGLRLEKRIADKHERS